MRNVQASSSSRPRRAAKPAPPQSPQPLELSIHHDEVEAHRIALERDLQQTDLSLHLSSAPPSNASDHGANHYDASSVEYGRHAAAPHAFRSFATDADDDDDDGAYGAYDAHSLSTAAHHASAVTLNAGLGGGRYARRSAGADVSLSGAEYDPERPLQDMIAGLGSRLSALDASSRKFSNSAGIAFDPVVVDDTLELDRFLASGRLPSSVRSSSPPSAASKQSAGRPRLADQLPSATFSPKRPRAGASPGAKPPTKSSFAKPPARRTTSPTVDTDEDDYQDEPTPRPLPARKPGHAPTRSQPNIQLQPPTPSDSLFGQHARHLEHDIATEKERVVKPQRSRIVSDGPVRPSAQRVQVSFDATPLRKTPTSVPRTVSFDVREPEHSRSSIAVDVRLSGGGKNAGTPMRYDRHGRSVHLPDMTGLTSAVGSPARLVREYRKYRAAEDARVVEARLVAALNTVQSRLSQIEDENGVSRRRVRELELELESCKADVARERTRVLEREEALTRKQRRTRQPSPDLDAEEAKRAEEARRYEHAVAEKKALEQLIGSLRAHLQRLTAEMSAHKDLLATLRSDRERDTATLEARAAETERLRAQVEALSGEVEVLRDVVEEGLQKRRSVREEQSSRLSLSALDPSSLAPDGTADAEDMEVHDDSRAGSSFGSGVEDSLAGRSGSTRELPPDRTMRTDRATVATDTPGAAPFGSSAAFGSSARSADLTELRPVSSAPSPRLARRSPPGSGRSSPARFQQEASITREWFSSVAGADDSDAEPARPAAPTPSGRRSTRVHTPPPADESDAERAPSPRPRRTAPAPSSRRPTPPPEEERDAEAEAAHALQTSTDAPFPRIRGAALERLFFSPSAPEHDARTCRACAGRGRTRVPTVGHGGDAEPGWLRNVGVHARAAKDGGAPPLPPQTVLARVVRELEDDFAHFKGIYMELAEQYAAMDAASNAARRRVLADHLREVIDELERRGDQIASLYDLLAFRDQPAGGEDAGRAEMGTQTNARWPPSTLRRSA